MKAVREHRLIHAVLAAAAACAGLAHAQVVTPVEVPPDCPTFYVDAINGSDSNPGTENSPFQTLPVAITSAGALGVPATVVFMPGSYSAGSTPISMPTGISLMGTSVLNTNFVGDSLRFDAMVVGAYDDVIIENIRFVSGSAQGAMITIDNSPITPIASNPTFSNCLFVDSAGIGVLIKSSSIGVPPLLDAEDADANGLLEHRPKFINCTFAQNKWGVIDTSTFGWGENEAGFINCLFANATGSSLSDIEGVDTADLTLANSSAISNAWHWGNRNSPSWAPTSIKNGRRAPDMQGLQDRVFDTVGPFALFLENSTVIVARGDFRLTPENPSDSPAVNKGVINFNPLWKNQTAGRRIFPCGQDAWDTDGEGYGNARIFEGSVDIGADEMGMLVVAGYVNGTTTVSGAQNHTVQAWIARPLSGASTFPALGVSGFGIRAMTNSNWIQWWPSFVPGIMAAHATLPTATPLGTLLMNPNVTPRVDLFVNRFTPVSIPLSAPGVMTQVNHQLLPVDSNGRILPLTNLQTYIVTP